MRKSPIVRALVTPKMSGGMSAGAMALCYGPAALTAFILGQWRWWAGALPFVFAVAGHAWAKYKFAQDVYYFEIAKVYNSTGDHYQPWPREHLRGRGQRPKGFGRGMRC
jgi:hypothetical protein